MNQRLQFPADFAWGVATAAAQIEGGAVEDGKGRSIWDEFASRPGKVADGSTPALACDHYHRYAEDFDIMKSLGIRHYRFSVSWPRIVPSGRIAQGGVNVAGLDFYERLVDAMLERGIEPYLTLYHWDLPEALQEGGGWKNRETVSHFEDYVRIVVGRLGDRVKNWMTHNEPWVVAFVGHLYGDHAPGLTDLRTALQTAHHILLSHGRAVSAIRQAAGAGARVGIVHNLEWVEPASPSEEDRAAAARHDGAFNRWFLDPVFKGEYPADMVKWYGENGPKVENGDLETIAAKIDFLGVNYYTRRIIAHDPAGDFIGVKRIAYPFVPHAEYEEWEVNPEGLYRLLMRVHRDYRPARMYVTENGTPLQDEVGADGRVVDPKRIDYLKGHTAAVYQAIAEGAPVGGYFVWSVMDNFEWGFGFTKRFGLVHVDFETLKRTVKESGRWYAGVIRENGFTVG